MIKKLKKEQLLIGALFGILLLVIAIPVPGEEEALQEAAVKTTEAQEPEAEVRLKEILQKISGVGRVEIYISYKDQGKLVVEKDETVSEELIEEADSNGGTRKTTTVQNERMTIFGGDDTPYVIQEISPSVEGVLVVAEGGGSEAIKNQIRNTIEALFGLEAHKISIMKMEVSK